MKVYGSKTSGSTRRVLMILAEKAYSHFEFIPIDLGKGEQKTSDHLARHPFGQVPVLDHDGFMLYESRAIMQYLDEALPGARFTPIELRQRAIMWQWISVEQANFSGPAWKVGGEYRNAPARGKEPDPLVIREGLHGVERVLNVLETHLANKAYLLGQNFSLADLTFMPYLELLHNTPAVSVLQSRPRVQLWWQTLRERPSWQKAIG